MKTKFTYGVLIAAMLLSCSLTVSLLVPGCNNSSDHQGDSGNSNTSSTTTPPVTQEVSPPVTHEVPVEVMPEVDKPSPVTVAEPPLVADSEIMQMEEITISGGVPVIAEDMSTLYYAEGEHLAPSPSRPIYDKRAINNINGMTYQWEQNADHNTQEYDKINDNAFKTVRENPLSTFSIDVDNASYSNVRRFINQGQMPYKDAVRIEEMINYFTYSYKQPESNEVFSVTTEVSDCPWNGKARLARIGIKGKELENRNSIASNLTFLLDVSGSMAQPNKLPLVQKAFKLLVNQLGDNDRVAIVVYAGAAGMVLPSTPASKKELILDKLNELEAGGSTAGGQGIELAYKIAKENFFPNGNNRVILATDGDFNVGISSTSELVRFIEQKRNDGIFLTICSFGSDNLKDSRMEQLSNAGNGNYYYIDDIMEANKVFVEGIAGTMYAIAKDVKIQVEFNPANVKAYRLVGYENRLLQNEDFNDDKKDAGELGAGHTVTALYEIIPAGSDFKVRGVDSLKYQTVSAPKGQHQSELMTVKVRYKLPKEDVSKLLSVVVRDESTPIANSSDDFRFAASVAGFGMLLRDSEHKGDLTYAKVIEMAQSGKGKDESGYRHEFITLVKKAGMMGM